MNESKGDREIVTGRACLQFEIDDQESESGSLRHLRGLLEEIFFPGSTKKFQNFSKTIITPNCAIFDARDVRNELYLSLYLAQMTVTFVLVRLAKFCAI